MESSAAMTPEVLSAWLVGVMMTTLPPGRAQPPDAAETVEEGKARYGEIADALANVVLDPSEPSLWRGPSGRARTAALVLAVSYLESGWRKDVDLGQGKHARGDDGNSWCMMQMHVGRGTTLEGWTGPDLVASREKCFRAGLHALRRSQRACRSRPIEEMLNAYASGTCTRGAAESRQRVGLAMRWYDQYPRPHEEEVAAR
jgi:hypothetical protein